MVRRFPSHWSFAKFDWSSALVRELKGISADVFHLHTPNPSMIFAWQRAGQRSPLVITHHSDVIAQPWRRRLFQLWEERCYRRAARILVTNPLYADGSALLQKHEDRVRVVPMGLNLEVYLHPTAEQERAADELRQCYGSPLWLACGRLVYYKGLAVALEALAQTPGNLVVIGEGPEGKILERRAEQLGIKERVHFLGRLPRAGDLIAYYRAATALWFPSTHRSEAFGLVQVEAMASGCPVINTAIPQSGVPWVCRDGQEGVTVPVGDPGALAQAAQRLVAEPELRSRLSRGGRARSQALFSSAVMVQKNLEQYAEVLTA